MLIRIAWKNIWRNKTRSIILVAAIALGLLGGLLASGISYGMGDQMISSAVSTHLSTIQIHSKTFRENQNINDSIPNTQALVKKIKAIHGVSGVVRRVVVMAMASSPTTAAGVALTGIIPEEEKKITGISSSIVQGSYFGNNAHNPVVIGLALAQELDLKEGSKIVFTFQNDSGEITGGGFRVAGIFKTVSTTFDKTAAFIRADDLHRLIGTESAWHEIAILLSKNAHQDSVKAQVSAIAGTLQVDTWKQLAPELAYVSESLGVTLYIFMIVILIALAFGIVNTMLMVVLERRRELGMLMAIGMPRSKIFGMIILETVILSLTGACAGMSLAVGTMALLSHTGIDLSKISKGLNQFGIPEVLYPSLPVSMYPILTGMVIATAIAAAVYPAVKALKLRPSEALRTM